MKTDHRTDTQLIRSAARGDKKAFSVLAQRYEDTVFRFAFKLARDKTRAEEILQDTLIDMYRSVGSFDGRSKFSTWLYTIVTNNFLMKQRKRKLDGLIESLDDLPTHPDGSHRVPVARWDETPADVLMKKELHALLDNSILKLPADYRVVFTLRDLEGKSTEETAKIAKISVEATKSRLRRARAFLRSQLSVYMNRRGVQAK